MATTKKQKLFEFKFWMVNLRSDKCFEVTIKGTDLQDASNKAKTKFPYPLYKFEWE